MKNQSDVLREYALIRKLIKSEGYELLISELDRKIKTNSKKLLAQQTEGREWLAGYINGMEQVYSIVKNKISSGESATKITEV